MVRVNLVFHHGGYWIFGPQVAYSRKEMHYWEGQGEWSASRKGRIMSCSTCGQPGHNARGCEKQSKEKQPTNGNRKSQRTTDEASEDYAAGSPAPTFMPTEVDVHLSAPQHSQNSQRTPTSQFVFMPTPTVLQQSRDNIDLDFEFSDIEVDEETTLRPRTVSEITTRLKERQQAQIQDGRRIIGFVGDSTGACLPRQLAYSPTKATWNGRAAVTCNQLEKQRNAKLKSRKGNGKTQVDVL